MHTLSAPIIAHYLSWAICLSLSGRAASSSVCPLPWNADPSLPQGVNKSKECPFGTRIPKFDVTVPKDPRWVDWVWVGYGIMPFLVIGIALVEMVIKAWKLGGIGTREFSFLGYVFFIVIINELVFKNMLKQPRPDQSCNFTCGFPSGHSTMSVGYFSLLFLDSSFRVMPKMPMDIESASHFRNLRRGKMTFLGGSTRDWTLSKLRAFTLIPISSVDTLGAFDFITTVVFWGVLLLPVPESRIRLGDHTPEQVFVGGCIGAFEAVFWFVIVRKVICRRWTHLLGTRVCYIFVHNHPLPRFEIISQCVCLMAEVKMRGEEGVSADHEKLWQQLIHMHSALDWYCAKIHRHSPTPSQLEQRPQLRRQGTLMQYLATDWASDQDVTFEQHEVRLLKKWQKRISAFLEESNSETVAVRTWCHVQGGSTRPGAANPIPSGWPDSTTGISPLTSSYGGLSEGWNSDTMSEMKMTPQISSRSATLPIPEQRMAQIPRIMDPIRSDGAEPVSLSSSPIMADSTLRGTSREGTSFDGQARQTSDIEMS